MKTLKTKMNVNETYGEEQPGGFKTHMLVIQNIFTIFHDALFSLEISNSQHLFLKMFHGRPV